MAAAKAIYRSPYAIPAEGIEAGDYVVIRPSDPDRPVEILRWRDRHALVRIMGDGHLDRMILIGGDLAEPCSPPQQHPLFPLSAGPRLVRPGA